MAQDAISLLKQDHKTVKDLLAQLTETTDRAIKTRTDLLEQIASELRVHTKIEEEVLYPAFRDAGKQDEKKMFYEAVEEHRAVEELVLPDLEKTDPGSNQFAGRAKVLKELVEHHMDEEESEMFPAAKELFGKEQLTDMGEKMAGLKQRLTP
ncbi:hemerythrin domain-containing protein [Gilvimarinus sp. F26214L]|uniref:hemerythrin domain-containing protein n=1 Tax=Gilvimarinus sp. DZF01 TaxID=3461371 RepID=UPI004045F33D